MINTIILVMVERIVSLPTILDQYMRDKGYSLSKFLQNKIKEEIIKDGLEKKYDLNAIIDKRNKKAP